MKVYFGNLLISLDQLANTILGGFPDETISSRAGKAYARGATWAIVLCHILHLFDKGHCLRAIERDEGEPYEKSDRS